LAGVAPGSCGCSLHVPALEPAPVLWRCLRRLGTAGCFGLGCRAGAGRGRLNEPCGVWTVAAVRNWTGWPGPVSPQVIHRGAGAGVAGRCVVWCRGLRALGLGEVGGMAHARTLWT